METFSMFVLNDDTGEWRMFAVMNRENALETIHRSKPGKVVAHGDRGTVLEKGIVGDEPLHFKNLERRV